MPAPDLLDEDSSSSDSDSSNSDDEGYSPRDTGLRQVVDPGMPTTTSYNLRHRAPSSLYRIMGQQ
jgi:hypothetical protein